MNFIVSLSVKAIANIKNNSNLESLATAKMAVLLYRLGVAFTDGETGEDPTVYDFLPFADVADNKPKLSKKAREIIKGLIRDNIIDNRVIPLITRHLK